MIYSLIRVLGAILVLRIYGSHKTASIRMTWMLVILLLPIFGTALYLLIGLNGHSLRMRKRYEDIDRLLLPMLPGAAWMWHFFLTFLLTSRWDSLILIACN